MDAHHAAEQVVNVFGDLFQLVPSAGTNGLAISRIPSCGHTKVTAVPLHTVNPTLRFLSVNVMGSSGSARGDPSNGGQFGAIFRDSTCLHLGFPSQRTSQILRGVVQHEVQHLIISFEHAFHCKHPSTRQHPPPRVSRARRLPPPSLPPASFTRTAWSMHALSSMAVSFFADIAPRARLRNRPLLSSPRMRHTCCHNMCVCLQTGSPTVSSPTRWCNHQCALAHRACTMDGCKGCGSKTRIIRTRDSSMQCVRHVQGWTSHERMTHVAHGWESRMETKPMHGASPRCILRIKGRRLNADGIPSRSFFAFPNVREDLPNTCNAVWTRSVEQWTHHASSDESRRRMDIPSVFPRHRSKRGCTVSLSTQFDACTLASHLSKAKASSTLITTTWSTTMHRQQTPRPRPTPQRVSSLI